MLADFYQNDCYLDLRPDCYADLRPERLLSATRTIVIWILANVLDLRRLFSELFAHCKRRATDETTRVVFAMGFVDFESMKSMKYTGCLQVTCAHLV